MAITQLVYTSRAACEINDPILAAIQDSACRHNEPHGITGVLLYGSGLFIQLLEGPLEDVDAIYQRIAKDPRHNDVQIIYRTFASERRFPSWSMGVVNMESTRVELNVRDLWDEIDLDAITNDQDSNLLFRLFDAFQKHVEMPTPN